MATASSALDSFLSDVKRLKILHGSNVNTLMLPLGADAASLNAAVNAGCGLMGQPFRLAVPDDDSQALVPLTSVLPDGLTLRLYTEPLVRSSQEPLCNTALTLPSCAAVSSSPPLPTPSFDPCPNVSTTQGSAFQVVDVATRTTDVGLLERAALIFQQVSEQDQTRFAPFLPPTGANRHVSTASEPHFGSVPNVEREISQSQVSQVEQLVEATDRIDRFSRMATDLANERTLLAWMRTSMAAMRTAFAFLGVTAVTEGSLWDGIFQLSRISMITVVLIGCVIGTIRYKKVKGITFAVTPPQNFGRISIGWFSTLIITSTLAMTLGMYPAKWGRAE